MQEAVPEAVDPPFNLTIADKLVPLITTPKRIKIAVGGRGGSKCFQVGTQVIMADGSLRAVEDVRTGDSVMGPDSQPRSVLSTCSGAGPLYKVHQTSAIDYVVNQDHILSLKKSESCKREKALNAAGDGPRRPNGRYPGWPGITNINVTDAIQQSKRWQEHFRGYRAGLIHFPEQELAIAPYMLGIWLGDGTSRNFSITTMDPEIKEFVEQYAQSAGARVAVQQKPNNRAQTLGVRKMLSTGPRGSVHWRPFKEYGLPQNKHIPQCYLSNSETNRLELLAGLLDTDGTYRVSRDYVISQKRESLSRQIKYLADTLGFRTSITKRNTICCNNGKQCVAWSVHICGDVWRIPCKIERKKAKPEHFNKNKDFLLSMVTIEQVEDGDWAGFSLDGDHLFMLEDGTVTHNSIALADIFLSYCDAGERLCGAREFQNSIDESVHALMQARIFEIQGPDPANHTLHTTAKTVLSDAGGEIFYRGLERNRTALKSMFGVKRIWIEEASTVSEASIDILMPTIRELDSEIWCSLNRGSSKDPFSLHFLKPYEREIKAKGFYEDDDIMIVEINWYDNPWFPASLEQQRAMDKRLLPRAKYDHIWEGAYSDTVANAIIAPEWFDACVDAHKKLGWEPHGMEVVSHDPSDLGPDDKALCYRHGNVILDVKYKSDGDVNEGMDWALGFAIGIKADEFIWDGDGMGAGLRAQVKAALEGKRIGISMFRGSEEADNPDAIYEPISGELRKAKSNRETFLNNRAKYYWQLRDMMFRTYKAVVHGIYSNPDEMLSISSNIEKLDILRAEMCRVPLRDNPSGRIQIMSKIDMKRMKPPIDSPNGADCVMMSSAPALKRRGFEGLNISPNELTDPGVGY